MAGKHIDISKATGTDLSSDHICLENVYNLYFDKLYRYAKVICRSQALAKDVVSDVFLGLLKNKTDLSGIKNLEVYLMVSVKHQATQALVKVSPKKDLDVKINTIDHINPEELYLEKELKSLLDKAVADLPDKCQLVFRMAREKGLKYKEISKSLGISEKTVKSQLKRAQSKLKEEIFRFYTEDGESPVYDFRLIGSYLILVTAFIYDILKF